jgi:hypothetical protein
VTLAKREDTKILSSAITRDLHAEPAEKHHQIGASTDLLSTLPFFPRTSGSSTELFKGTAQATPDANYRRSTWLPKLIEFAD